MTEDLPKRPDNSLEDVAAEMTAGLGGDTVEVNDSSRDVVQAGQVHMKNSAVRRVEASAVHMEDCAAASVRGGSLEISDSAIALAYGREVRLSEATASVVAARHVQAEQVNTLVLVAGKAEGNIRAMLTPLTALAFGAGFGLVLFALQTAARRLLSSAGRRQKRVEKN